VRVFPKQEEEVFKDTFLDYQRRVCDAHCFNDNGDEGDVLELKRIVWSIGVGFLLFGMDLKWIYDTWSDTYT